MTQCPSHRGLLSPCKETEIANEANTREKDGGTLGRIERLPVCSFTLSGMDKKLLLKEPHPFTIIKAEATLP